MTRILAISAGLSQPSSTRMLADRLATATRGELDGETTIEVVELRDYAHDITDHLLTGFANSTCGTCSTSSMPPPDSSW